MSEPSTDIQIGRMLEAVDTLKDSVSNLNDNVTGVHGRLDQLDRGHSKIERGVDKLNDRMDDADQKRDELAKAVHDLNGVHSLFASISLGDIGTEKGKERWKANFTKLDKWVKRDNRLRHFLINLALVAVTGTVTGIFVKYGEIIGAFLFGAS